MTLKFNLERIALLENRLIPAIRGEMDKHLPEEDRYIKLLTKYCQYRSELMHRKQSLSNKYWEQLYNGVHHVRD